MKNTHGKNGKTHTSQSAKSNKSRGITDTNGQQKKTQPHTASPILSDSTTPQQVNSPSIFTSTQETALMPSTAASGTHQANGLINWPFIQVDSISPETASKLHKEMTASKSAGKSPNYLEGILTQDKTLWVLTTDNKKTHLEESQQWAELREGYPVHIPVLCSFSGDSRQVTPFEQSQDMEQKVTSPQPSWDDKKSSPKQPTCWKRALWQDSQKYAQEQFMYETTQKLQQGTLQQDSQYEELQQQTDKGQFLGQCDIYTGQQPPSNTRHEKEEEEGEGRGSKSRNKKVIRDIQSIAKDDNLEDHKSTEKSTSPKDAELQAGEVRKNPENPTTHAMVLSKKACCCFFTVLVPIGLALLGMLYFVIMFDEFPHTTETVPQANGYASSTLLYRYLTVSVFLKHVQIQQLSTLPCGAITKETEWNIVLLRCFIGICAQGNTLWNFKMRENVAPCLEEPSCEGLCNRILCMPETCMNSEGYCGHIHHQCGNHMYPINNPRGLCQCSLTPDDVVPDQRLAKT